MNNLSVRQDKIKEKRKNTPFREYLKTIVSWQTMTFYKNKKLISVFPETERRKLIVSPEEYENITDDNLKKGINYDFKKTIFDNFAQLLETVPLPSVWSFGNNENADFGDTITGGKNVYLSIAAVFDVENVFYSYSVKNNSRNVFNSSMVWDNSANIYMAAGVINGYNIFYSKYLHGCSNIRFSTNLIGCDECMFCDGLENKKYCVDNIQFTKEEYIKLKTERLMKKDIFLEWFLELTNKGNNTGSGNVEGSFLLHSQDVENAAYCYEVTNGRNVISVGGKGKNQNIYDSYGALLGQDFYANFSVGNASNLYCCVNSGLGGSNLYYCMNCLNCSFCLGCIGLKNKQFCILNKEYSKQEWYEKVNEIFQQMEDDGSLGEFFSGKLNPFYFNDTAAYLFEDFEKEEIEQEGYLRRDEEIKVDIPQGAEIIGSVAEASYIVPVILYINDFQGFDEEGNRQIDSEILKKVIIDENGNYYRIMPMELDFLNKHKLPLPEIHWLERIKLGFKFN